MTHGEKAKELIEKFQKEIPDYLYQGKMLDTAAKACAIVCVEEIMSMYAKFQHKYDYWQQVKNELQKTN